MKTIRDKVIILPDVVHEMTTDSGIVVPLTNKYLTGSTGEVVACGPGWDKENPMEVKVGDKVMYNSLYIDVIEDKGVEYHVLKQMSIIGIVTKS